MNGRLIYVVGPSGAGKDSVLDYARGHLPGGTTAVFARRTITRPATAGGENHIAVTDRQFEALQRAGAFALHWEANGLRYGVRTEIRDWLAAGLTVVVNGSRGYLPTARTAFPQLEAVLVTASPEVIRARLTSRGRETPAAVEARLARSVRLQATDGVSMTEIRNDGELHQAGKALLALLSKRGKPRSSTAPSLR